MHTFLLVAFGFVMPFLGVFGNGLILIVFARQKRKNVVDITLLFMAVVDFSVSCFHILKTISFKYGTNDFTCQLTIMTARAGIFASVFFTIALAAYRYRAICHPFRRPVSLRVGTLVSVASITVSVIINIPAFFIVDALPLRTGLLTCVIVDRSSWMEVAFSALSLLLFTAAVLVSTVLYSLLYRAIRKQQAVRKNLLGGRGRFKAAQNQTKPNKPPTDGSDASSQGVQSAPSNLSTTMIGLDAIQEATPNDVTSAESNINTVVMVADNEIHTTNANEDQFGKDGHSKEQDMENGDDPSATEQAKTVEPRLKVDKKSAQPEDKGHHVTRLLFIITVIFLVTWFPSIAYEYLPTNLTMSREHTLSSATLLLVQLKLSNHFINVFVYLAVNARFRRQVRELFCCCG
ncbi:oxytocin receptor-like [Lytechinus pictus]|uniref:oxytocin receptor-like n=1 Tax=Lytechinus pictus TaxID=7653 RepID=UPI0030B9C32F